MISLLQGVRKQPCSSAIGPDDFYSVPWQSADFTVDRARVDFDGVTAELPVAGIAEVAGHAVMLARCGSKDRKSGMLVLVSSPVYLLLPKSNEPSLLPVFRILAALRARGHFVRQRNHSNVPFIHKGQIPTGDLIRALSKTTCHAPFVDVMCG